MKVADLTVTQFRQLVTEIVDQKLTERLGPVPAARANRKLAASRVTLEQVCKEFGILLKE